MADDIPQWAKKRAVELACSEMPNAVTMFGLESMGTGCAFARYIAAHEEPPVDPVEVLDGIIERCFRWHNAGRVVAQELAANGLKIVEAE